MISNEIRESLQHTCSALNKHGVEYMLIGGIAVGFYGYQRPSGVPEYGMWKQDLISIFGTIQLLKTTIDYLLPLRKWGKILPDLRTKFLTVTRPI